MANEINCDAVEAAIAKLRRERGSAVLDGKKFDSSKITAAEADLAAFDDAEVERVRREREREEQDEKASLAHKKKRIGKLEGDRQKAWADVEAASRALLEAIGRVKAATESERVLWADITAAVPMALGPFESAHRLRGRIGEFLHAAKVGFDVPGAGGIYGQAPIQDWGEIEREAMASNLQAISEE